jgi:hypothetical protein
MTSISGSSPLPNTPAAEGQFSDALVNQNGLFATAKSIVNGLVQHTAGADYEGVPVPSEKAQDTASLYSSDTSSVSSLKSSESKAGWTDDDKFSAKMYAVLFATGVTVMGLSAGLGIGLRKDDDSNEM